MLDPNSSGKFPAIRQPHSHDCPGCGLKFECPWDTCLSHTGDPLDDPFCKPCWQSENPVPPYPAREGPDVADPVEEREPLHLWSRLGAASITLLLAAAVLVLVWFLLQWAGPSSVGR